MKNRWNLQQAQQLMSDQSASGQSKQDFCADRKINPATFYSLPAKQSLNKDFTHVIMPKKGNKTVNSKPKNRLKLLWLYATSIAQWNQILTNWMEHSGVNKVPDKGIHGFKRHVAFGVLAYNIKRLGKLVIEQELLDTVIQPGKLRKAA